MGQLLFSLGYVASMLLAVFYLLDGGDFAAIMVQHAACVLSF